MPGYQINPDALRWVAGNGEERPMDRTRLLDAGEIPPQVNEHFVECYRRFVDLKAVLEARSTPRSKNAGRSEGARGAISDSRPAALVPVRRRWNSASISHN
jgi:hypothetical protein